MRRRTDDAGRRLCDYPPCNRREVRAEHFTRFGAWCQDCWDMRQEAAAEAEADDFAREDAGTETPLD